MVHLHTTGVNNGEPTWDAHMYERYVRLLLGKENFKCTIKLTLAPRSLTSVTPYKHTAAFQLLQLKRCLVTKRHYPY